MPNREGIQILARVLRQEAEALSQIADRLDKSLDETFATAIEWIASCNGRVVACGLGKSGHVARKSAGTLASTGTPSVFLHAAEALHGDLGMVTKDDIVLLYTYSGESDEIARLIPALRAIGAKTIAITGRPDSTVAREADINLNVQVEREACPNNLAPTTSTTAMMAVSDGLAIAVMEARNFTEADFAKYHPSGTLGRRLTLRVRDIMRQGDDLATATPDTPLVDLLQSITKAGAGGAVVTDPQGAVIGFVSDGDVRRYLVGSGGDLQTTAGAIMSPNPSLIEADLLAIEALEAFQNHPKKIGEIPVVANNRLAGLLVLKDLLRSGIV